MEYSGYDQKFEAGGIRLYQADCMKMLPQITDKYYQLCICDPPYGIGDRFKGGKSGKMQFNEIVKKAWDRPPSPEYFQELFRVTKNQIIWGGNYFNLPPSRCFIVWDKLISEDFSLAMIEMAWTSFDALAKQVRMPTPKNGKIHPTQKPVALYKWLLKNYAKPGDRILDTHLGSGSSAIAAYDMGFELTGYEIDKDYFEAAVERIKRHMSQGVLPLDTPRVHNSTLPLDIKCEIVENEA